MHLRISIQRAPPDFFTLALVYCRIVHISSADMGKHRPKVLGFVVQEDPIFYTMVEQFMDKEEKEGVRWNWNKYPGTKAAADSMVSLLLCPISVRMKLRTWSYESSRCFLRENWSFIHIFFFLSRWSGSFFSFCHSS